MPAHTLENRDILFFGIYSATDNKLHLQMYARKEDLATLLQNEKRREGGGSGSGAGIEFDTFVITLFLNNNNRNNYIKWNFNYFLRALVVSLFCLLLFECFKFRSN